MLLVGVAGCRVESGSSRFDDESEEADQVDEADDAGDGDDQLGERQLTRRPVQSVGESPIRGTTTLDVPPSPEGFFLEFGAGEYSPQLYFPYPPPTAPFTAFGSYAIRVVDYEALNEANGWSLDAGRGTLQIFVRDCKGLPAPGVSLSASTADERTIAAYGIDDGSGDAEVTDAAGTVIFFNLPAGAAVITATVPALCTQVGAIGALVKADTLGVAPLAPTP